MNIRVVSKSIPVGNVAPCAMFLQPHIFDQIRMSE